MLKAKSVIYLFLFTISIHSSILTHKNLTSSHSTPALACFKYTWDKNSNVTSITDPLGFVTSFDLDLMGRVIAIHEPSQIPGQPPASTYLTLDGEGRVLNSKDAIGRETRFTYNSDGFLIEVIAPDASRTFYEYQGDRLVQVTDSRRGIWQIEYNGENQITKITDPEGNQSSTTYNQFGQKITETDFLGRTSSFSYDKLGNLSAISDPLGAQTQLTYDANQRLVKKILPDGEVQEFIWEAGDFLAQKKWIASLSSGTTPSERIQSFLGDEYGRITQSVTSQNEAWPQTYDAASLLAQTSFPEGGFLLSRYDSLNRPEKLIDRGGAERVFTYTPQGQEKSLKMPPTAQHPQGRETIREYNPAGELIRITYPDLSLEEIERDLMGRPIRITYTPSASGSGSSAPIPNSAPAHSEELILTYNQAGDLVEIRSQLPGGQNPKTITQTFDILGRLTSKELPFLNRRIELEYNGASEITVKREIDLQTQAIRTSLYAYTNRGELASLTENGSTTLFEYSPGGKITKITYPEGISLTQSYNGFGELQSQIWKNSSDETLHEILYEYNLNGKITRITTPEGQTQYSYDSESRLVQTIHPDGNIETFTFNSSGYLSEKKDNSRRLVMNYNESGQVVEVLEYIPPTNPSATNRQVWNWFSDGLLRSVENTTTNTATYYLWNAQKKLEGVAFTDGTSTAYAYLPGSDLRLSSVNRSGTATLFHWDGVQLREVLHPSEGSPNSPPVAIGGRATNLPTDSNPTHTITSAYLTGLPGTWDEVLTASIPAGENPENLLLFLQNHQSSVVGSLETSNPLVSRQLFTYLAYGEPKGTSPENLPLSGIGYTGRQHDDTGLMYYRGRYRDSCTGTFIQEDKMRDGWNWYGYSNDPVNMVDPSGQVIQFAVAGGVIGGAVNAGIAAWDGKNSKEIGSAFFSGFSGGFVGSGITGLASLAGASLFMAGAMGGVSGTVAMKGMEKGGVGLEDVPAIAISGATGGLLNKIGGFRLNYTAGQEAYRNEINATTKKLLEKNLPFPPGWAQEHKRIMSTSTRVKELLVETFLEGPINTAAFAAGLPITNAIVDAVAFKSYLFIERLCSK